MNAPGCYGAASVFCHDSAACRACPAFTECSRESLQRLQSLQDKIDVSDLLKKHHRAQANASPAREQRQHDEETRDTRVIQRAQPIEPIQRKTKLEKIVFHVCDETQTIIGKIGNKKAQDQAIALCKAGTLTQIVEAFQKGENPFPETPRWLRAAGGLLLAGPVSKSEMKASFAQLFGWTDGTAGSHVSIVVSLVMGLGIAVEKDGAFILNPSTVTHDAANS